MGEVRDMKVQYKKKYKILFIYWAKKKSTDVKATLGVH